MNRIDQIRQDVEQHGSQGFEAELLDEIVRLRVLIHRIIPFVEKSDASANFLAELREAAGQTVY